MVKTESIKGIHISGEDHEVALYADDGVFISEPNKTF